MLCLKKRHILPFRSRSSSRWAGARSSSSLAAEFETPLDIRLRTDSLARPLLFVGYSLQDMNTRYMLFRLQELWENSDCAPQRPLSYVLMTQPQPAQETVLRSRGLEPLVWEDEDPGRATRVFLEALLQAMRPNQS